MRIGVARVSTREQHPEAQEDALRAAGCERIFTDKASGKLARRPELDKALMVARDGDQLVVTKLDRLGRSLEHLIELSKDLQNHGIDLVVLDQGIDTSTAVGRMFFQILGAIAEFEHALMSERTHDGLAAARARGRTGGQKPKLGRRQIEIARAMYDETGPDGRRRYTVQQIANEFRVTRPTIYRHLSADQTAPAGDVDSSPEDDWRLPDTTGAISDQPDLDELFDAFEDLAEVLRGEQLPGELGAALSDPAAAFLAAWDVLDGLADYQHSPTTPTGLLTAAARLTPLLPARNETLAEPEPAPAGFPDGDPIHRRRWYTKAELDGYQLVKAADHDVTGTYDVIVAGERVGQIRPGRTATGARSGWQAIYRMTPVAHTGKGRAARTQQAAVVDLLSDLQLRWSNAHGRDRRS